MRLSELIEKYGDCEVSEELVEMVRPEGEWDLKIGEKYWFIGCDEVVETTWEDLPSDLFLLGKRNVYLTEEEAQFALNMYHFCKERSFEPDWEDQDQVKCLLLLNFQERNACCVACSATNHAAPFYYHDFATIQEIINKYSFEELAKYYGRV